jgi:SP family facilitated glucose transporter-like MFS transporter 1
VCWSTLLALDMADGLADDVTVTLVFAILAGAFGSGFQHGYNTGVLNEIQNVTMEWIRQCGREGSQDCEFTMVETTYIWAWIVSIFCLGGLVGGLSVGVAASSVGRKKALLANNTFVFIGGSLMVCARAFGAYALLVGGRFVIGVAAGFAAGLTPMYLSEISPASVRGAVGTVYQLIITCSILTSQILGVKDLMGTSELWPTLLGLTMLPGLLQCATLPWCPESPCYLYIDREDEIGAIKALQWLRRREDVTRELEEMRVEKDSQAKDMISFRDLFKLPYLRRVN